MIVPEWAEDHYEWCCVSIWYWGCGSILNSISLTNLLQTDFETARRSLCQLVSEDEHKNKTKSKQSPLKNFFFFFFF